MYDIKLQERKAAIRGVVQQILESGYIDFPHGLEPEDVIALLDFDGNMELNHEEFLTGLGRLLLGNEFQMTCLILTMTGKSRAENRMFQKGLEERIDGQQSSLRGFDERLAGIERSIEKLAS